MPFQQIMRHLAIWCALGLMAAACAGRARQPVVQPGPSPIKNASTGTAPGAGQTSELPPDQANASSSTSTASGTNDGLSGEGSPDSGGSTNDLNSPGSDKMVITTALADGSTVTVEWDGKSFVGNELFDLRR